MTSTTASEVERNWPEFCAWLNERHRQINVPGASAGVLTAASSMFHASGVTSVEDPLPVTPETLFLAGSITKPIVATALLTLSEAARLELDQPLSESLPAFPFHDAERRTNLTLRHLLSHTGGWQGDHFVDTGDGDDALARYAEQLASLPQLLQPGRFWFYSNTGYALAGYLLEALTNQPFERAMRQLILNPLGMPLSTFSARDVLTRRHAAGHGVKPEGPRVTRPWGLPKAMNPAGGLVSNAPELLRFAAMQLHLEGHTGVLSEASVAAMKRPQVAARLPFGEHAGLGWYLRTTKGHRVVWHPGFMPGQRAALILVPAAQFALVVLTNADTGALLLEEAEDWWLDRLPGRRVAGDAAPDLTREAVVLDGVYRGPTYTARFSTTSEGTQVRLAGRDPVGRELDDRSALRVHFKDGDSFLIDGASPYIKHGALLRDEQGAVAWCGFGPSIAVRVPEETSLRA